MGEPLPSKGQVQVGRLERRLQVWSTDALAKTEAPRGTVAGWYTSLMNARHPQPCSVAP